MLPDVDATLQARTGLDEDEEIAAAIDERLERSLA